MALPSRAEYLAQLETETCPMCYEDLTGAVKTACNHSFCRECLTTWLQSSSTCPTCRTKLREPQEAEDGEYWWEEVQRELEQELQNSDDLSSIGGDVGESGLDIELSDRRRKRSVVEEEEDEDLIPDDRDPEFVQYMLSMTNHILHTTDHVTSATRVLLQSESNLEKKWETKILAMTREDILSQPTGPRDCFLALRVKLGAPGVADGEPADPRTELRLQVLALRSDGIMMQEEGLRRQLVHLRWFYGVPLSQVGGDLVSGRICDHYLSSFPVSL